MRRTRRARPLKAGTRRACRHSVREGNMRRTGALVPGLAVCAFAVGVALSSNAGATVVSPFPDPYSGPPGPAGPFNWTATPGYIQTWYSNNQSADVPGGNGNPTNVEAALESAAWMNMSLTFVGSIGCGTGIICPNGGSGPTQQTYTLPIGVNANVWGVHFDNKFAAFLYGSAIHSFAISGLGQGISGIFAFCSQSGCGDNNTGPPPQVPLPPAVLLFGSALVGLTVLGRR